MNIPAKRRPWLGSKSDNSSDKLQWLPTTAPFLRASWAREIAVNHGSTTVSSGIHSAPCAFWLSMGSLLYSSDRLSSLVGDMSASLDLWAMIGNFEAFR
jgi:hypothetical protein